MKRGKIPWRVSLLLMATILVFAVGFTAVTLMLFNPVTPNATNTLLDGFAGVEIEEETHTYTPRPGDELDKKPKVENTGNVTVWVRVLLAGGLNEYDIDYNSGWTLPDPGGYCYYKAPLESGGATSSLFDKIILHNSFHDGNALDIAVYAECVQWNEGETDPVTAFAALT